MGLHLGDIAPNFKAKTTAGDIDFHEYLGDSWGILFSHPADFTPVCTTELGRINETQHCNLDFPIIADPDRVVAFLYDMIHPKASETFTVRSLFVIGPDKKVKLIITYPASTGRNFYEILRVIDSLQLTENYSVVTPADWKEGEDVIVVPSISTADAVKKFSKGVKEIKPYLRYTPQPDR